MKKKTAQKRRSFKVNPLWRIGIVASMFYQDEMKKLIEGARGTFLEAGIPANNISVYETPGSFEVPLIGSMLAAKKKVDALIGLGIIIEGETHHANLLAENATRGIMDTQLKYGIPFAFEILYVDSLKLAHARLNKGTEAANAVLQSLSILKNI